MSTAHQGELISENRTTASAPVPWADNEIESWALTPKKSRVVSGMNRPRASRLMRLNRKQTYPSIWTESEMTTVSVLVTRAEPRLRSRTANPGRRSKAWMHGPALSADTQIGADAARAHRKRLDILARLIITGHDDIRLHLERVQGAIAVHDPDLAYGALIDLFLATNPTHQRLRSQAMMRAHGVLAPEQETALNRFLATGLDPHDDIDYTAASLLSRGRTGRRSLIVTSAARPKAEAAPFTPRRHQSDDDIDPDAVVRRIQAEANARMGGDDHTTVHGWSPAPDALQGPVDAAAFAQEHRFDPTTTLAGLLSAATEPAASGQIHWVVGPFGSIRLHADLAELDLTTSDLVPWVSGSDAQVISEPWRAPAMHKTVSASNLIWDLAVLASDGRLPTTLPLRQPLMVRRWPDLDHLARVPGDVRLCALLRARPHSVEELLNRSGSRAATCTFLAAAWLSGLLELVDRRQDPMAAASTEPTTPNPSLSPERTERPPRERTRLTPWSGRRQ